MNGQSKLRGLAKTGEVVQSRTLSRPYFGEGITILGDTIFQLTWQVARGLCLR